MSRTTDHILNNPGINFDGSPIVEQSEPAYLSLSDWQGMTEKQIKEQAKTLVATVLEIGEADKVAERIKAMETFTKAVKDDKDYKDYVLEQVALHNGLLKTKSGATIERMEAGTKYDYSKNPQWVELNKQIKALEDRLKKIPPGALLVDEETGETLIGPAKSSTTTYKITLAK